MKRRVRVIETVACVALVGAAGTFSFLALIFTGGDSGFATKSTWIYSPWLIALTLTLFAITVTALGKITASAILIVASVAAYALTWIVWDPLGPV